MLIVITSEKDIPNEAEQLNQLFASGLEVLHLRKPNWNSEEVRHRLTTIDEKYHNRIVLHQSIELVHEFDLKGIHLKEITRKALVNTLDGFVNAYKSIGLTLSTSFHSVEELKNQGEKFDYVFLSPVFDSISKEGYEGKGFDVKDVSKKVIGLGGISSENINQLGELGYAGAAVLGTIWNSNDPVNTFKTLNIR